MLRLMAVLGQYVKTRRHCQPGARIRATAFLQLSRRKPKGHDRPRFVTNFR